MNIGWGLEEPPHTSKMECFSVVVKLVVNCFSVTGARNKLSSWCKRRISSWQYDNVFFGFLIWYFWRSSVPPPAFLDPLDELWSHVALKSSNLFYNPVACAKAFCFSLINIIFFCDFNWTRVTHLIWFRSIQIAFFPEIRKII